MQLIFGAVDFPSKFVALGMLSFLGRRLTQVLCLLMSALVIFANIFVPAGKEKHTIPKKLHVQYIQGVGWGVAFFF